MVDTPANILVNKRIKTRHKIWCQSKNVADPFHKALPKVLPITYAAKCFRKSRRPKENKNENRKKEFISAVGNNWVVKNALCAL